MSIPNISGRNPNYGRPPLSPSTKKQPNVLPLPLAPAPVPAPTYTNQRSFNAPAPAPAQAARDNTTPDPGEQPLSAVGEAKIRGYLQTIDGLSFMAIVYAIAKVHPKPLADQAQPILLRYMRDPNIPPNYAQTLQQILPQVFAAQQQEATLQAAQATAQQNAEQTAQHAALSVLDESVAAQPQPKLLVGNRLTGPIPPSPSSAQPAVLPESDNRSADRPVFTERDGDSDAEGDSTKLFYDEDVLYPIPKIPFPHNEKGSM